jgi:hypothetical protein
MSDCGGLVVACLAAPLLLVVLLVAGVSYLAIQGAKLAGYLALEGVNFAAQSLAAGVRASTRAIAAAAPAVLEGIERAGEWAREMYDSSAAVNRLRQTAQDFYQKSLLSSEQLHASVSGMVLSSAVAPASCRQNFGSGTLALQQAADLLARAQAVRYVLDAELPLKLIVERWESARVNAAESAMHAASVCLAGGRVEEARELASRAESFYTTALHDAHQRLRNAERATITAQVGNTLEDLGYEVKVARVKENVALVGRRAHQTLAMVLQPGGQIQLDMAGFEGNACERETRELLRALRRNGLSITAEHLVRHGRFSGGPWIRKAQQKGKPLEVALAEMVDFEQPARSTHAAAAPVRRASRLGPLGSEEERLRTGRALLWSNRQQLN